ncbi:MAG: methylmalonyl Co-A mutase-associated GTPase MeaB, partial [Mucilaginibacter sp.]
LRAADFDYILIETVGVGQSEIEIAGLADITFVVLVPESGDDIQNIKSGLMEIADAFVINKADRDGADLFVNNIKKMLQQKNAVIPVFKTTASENKGIIEIVDFILSSPGIKNSRRAFLLAEKAYKLIQQKRMDGVNKAKLQQAISMAISDPDFNLYCFVDEFPH